MYLGILTFHKSKNYGSALQAFAMQTYFQFLGHEVELIDYVPPEQEALYSIFKKDISAKSIAENIVALLDYKYLKKKSEKFEHFWTEYKLSSSIRYDTEIEKIGYDVICVGSDQVWNINIVDFNMIYLLPFQCSKKFSYAVSMGKLNKADLNNMPNEFTYYLNEFNSISVREKYTAQVLSDKINRDIQVVLDPTFLLDVIKWNELSGEEAIIKGEYILFYSIEYYDDYIDCAKNIAKKLKLPVYVIYTCRKTYKAIKKGFRRVVPCSPFEFLNCIKNAKYVISSSFHGCVFSIIFNKEFLAMERFIDGKVVYEDRLRSLLESFKISDHIINFSTKQNDFSYKKINYSTVNKLVKEKVADSKKYIEEVLSEL